MLIKFRNILRKSISLGSSCYYSTKGLKMPSAVVILPPGAEEMEFVGSVDILRRAGVSEFCSLFLIWQNFIFIFF